MSNHWLYEVTAEFDDSALAAAWAEWMQNEHIADVVKAGALNGRLLRPAENSSTFIAQYEFASESALKTYLETQSPRLRTEAANRFDPARIKYTRRTAEIIS